MNRKPRAYLKDRTGEVIEARLLEEMTVEAVAQANASWRSLVEEHRKRLIAQGAPRAEWPQHHHWDWEKKAERYGGLLSYRFVGVEHAGTVQGMMMVNLDAERCRVPQQRGKPLVYVEYLASAPWNSPLFMAEPLFTGVGTMLVFAAIQLSLEQGYGGRIGLHSLPQAETFYQCCGMTELGIDADYYDLCYFEMTAKQAELFLS